MKKSIEKQLKANYMQAKQKVEQEPYIWDTYNEEKPLSTPDWRLWKSVSDLDVTLSYVMDLNKKAQRKRKTILLPVIKRIWIEMDQALTFLDPEHWPRKGLLDVTLNYENLKKALNCLRDAYSLYETIYMDVSLNVEAPSTLKAQKRAGLSSPP